MGGSGFKLDAFLAILWIPIQIGSATLWIRNHIRNKDQDPHRLKICSLRGKRYKIEDKLHHSETFKKRVLIFSYSKIRKKIFHFVPLIKTMLNCFLLKNDKITLDPDLKLDPDLDSNWAKIQIQIQFIWIHNTGKNKYSSFLLKKNTFKNLLLNYSINRFYFAL